MDRVLRRWACLAITAIAAPIVCALQTAQSATNPQQPPAVDRPVRTVPAKILRYCRRLVGKYDRNRNGRLERAEWSRMRGNPRLADADGDSTITLEELARRVADYGRYRSIRPLSPYSEGHSDLPALLHPTTNPESSAAPDARKPSADGDTPPAGPDSSPEAAGRTSRRDLKFFVPRASLAEGLPDWFLDRDADGDGQLTLGEFAPRPAKSQLDQFTRYDANQDGLITADECLQATKAAAPTGPAVQNE